MYVLEQQQYEVEFDNTIYKKDIISYNTARNMYKPHLLQCDLHYVQLIKKLQIYDQIQLQYAVQFVVIP